jgi:hypothetical protein
MATHEVVPGSRLVIFQDVGHYPPPEDPAQFVQVLVDFMARTSPARVSERHWRDLFQHPADEPR